MLTAAIVDAPFGLYLGVPGGQPGLRAGHPDHTFSESGNPCEFGIGEV